MSLESMKLLTIAGPIDRFDDVVSAYILEQEIHLEPAMRLMKNAKGLRPMATSNVYATSLRRAENLASRLSIPLSKSENSSDWNLDSATAYFDDLERRLSEITTRRDALSEEIDHCHRVADEMNHLQGFSAKLDGLWDMQYTRFRFGYLPRETYHSFETALSKREDVFFFPTSTERDRIYGVYFTSKSAHEEVDSLMNSLHFVRVWIDAAPTGTPQEVITSMNEQVQAAQAEQQTLSDQLAELQKTEQEKLLSAYTWLRYHKECQDVHHFACYSRKTFYLTGWVPESAIPALTKKLDADPDVPYVLDDGPGAELGLVPPSKLKSGFMARIFRPFLELYGLPSYNEVDPSSFMALTYCLFFGIMFGDLGQGLGVALIGALLWKFKKLWLGKIITCCGLSGAVFGCVYGSVFGFEDVLPGFKILEGNHVMLLLMLSVALGVGILLLCMGINVINGIKQHNFEKILFGPNGVAGAVFYCGLIIMGVATATGMANLLCPAYILPVLVLPLVLMLFKEPLSRLMIHDPNWKKVNLGELVGLGFFELFETLLSYITNTLSFLRVGAYAIIHVGLMLVVQMIAGSGNIVILVLGNLFVMGFEGFLVGIQVLRLEFYELFSRFYDDSGIAFKPHTIDYTVRTTH